MAGGARVPAIFGTDLCESNGKMLLPLSLIRFTSPCFCVVKRVQGTPALKMMDFLLETNFHLHHNRDLLSGTL